MMLKKATQLTIALSLLILGTSITATAAETDKVLGSINGQAITQNQFLTYIRLTAPRSDLKDKNVQQKLLQAYVGRELLYQDALTRKIDQIDLVKKVIEEQRHSIISKALASEILKAKPITEAQLRTIYDQKIAKLVKNEKTDGEAKQLPPFEQVKGRISQSLQDKMISEYVGELFKKAKIEIH